VVDDEHRRHARGRQGGTNAQSTKRTHGFTSSGAW
jgi:hypothetical protein